MKTTPSWEFLCCLPTYHCYTEVTRKLVPMQLEVLETRWHEEFHEFWNLNPGHIRRTFTNETMSHIILAWSAYFQGVPWYIRSFRTKFNWSKVDPLPSKSIDSWNKQKVIPIQTMCAMNIMIHTNYGLFPLFGTTAKLRIKTCVILVDDFIRRGFCRSYTPPRKVSKTFRGEDHPPFKSHEWPFGKGRKLTMVTKALTPPEPRVRIWLLLFSDSCPP